MMDFSADLKEMNDSFRSGKDIDKDGFKPPFWVKGDALEQIYNDLPNLYQFGEVVYAYIVQANNHLYKSFPPFNSPADIIFSFDDSYAHEPMGLREIAYSLCGFKGAGEVPPEIKQIADSVTNDLERSFNVPLPLSFTDNKQIYFTTTIVYRKHLPKKRIVSPIFPIICAAEKSNVAVILPRRYWTKNFIRYYKGNAD